MPWSIPIPWAYPTPENSLEPLGSSLKNYLELYSPLTTQRDCVFNSVRHKILPSTSTSEELSRLLYVDFASCSVAGRSIVVPFPRVCPNCAFGVRSVRDPQRQQESFARDPSWLITLGTWFDRCSTLLGLTLFVRPDLSIEVTTFTLFPSVVSTTVSAQPSCEQPWR